MNAQLAIQNSGFEYIFEKQIGDQTKRSQQKGRPVGILKKAQVEASGQPDKSRSHNRNQREDGSNESISQGIGNSCDHESDSQGRPLEQGNEQVAFKHCYQNHLAALGKILDIVFREWQHPANVELEVFRIFEQEEKQKHGKEEIARCKQGKADPTHEQ